MHGTELAVISRVTLAGDRFTTMQCLIVTVRNFHVCYWFQKSEMQVIK